MSIFRLKNFWLILLILLFMVSGIIVVMSVLSISPYSYSKAFRDKENRLARSAGDRKIVFIGGSNLAYGIHSDLIQSNFPSYRIFNMGLHAGIGLKTMIDQVEPYIGAGDVVIVAPEYEQFINMFYGNSSGMYLEAVADQPRFLRTFSYKSFPALLEPLPSSLQSRAIQLVRNLRGSDKSPFLYSRNSFNEYGDVNRHVKMTESRVDMHQYNTLSYKDSKFVDQKDAIEYINGFRLRLESRGAKLYLAYPAFMQSIYPRCEREIGALDREIRKAGLQPLYSPERYVLPETEFLDTSYHLLYRASGERTKDMIQFMSKVIEN